MTEAVNDPSLADAFDISIEDDAAPATRNILRSVMLRAAQRLEVDPSSAGEVASELRDACEKDAALLDEGDIEIDVEAVEGGPGGHELLGMILGGNARPLPRVDPVDKALLEAIALRDRISAQRIAGADPDPEILGSYDASLDALRDALSAARPVNAD
jgi:hypothetical protein